MNRLRRATLLVPLAGSLAPITAATWAARSAGAAELPQPDDLDAVLARAHRERMAVVAVFTRRDCSYCIALKREHLVSLAAEARSRGLVLVEIDVEVERPLRAGGVTLSRMEFARRFGGQFTPTVVFLGPGFTETAPRLVGYNARDFYTAYLDTRIEQAVAAAGGARMTR